MMRRESGFLYRLRQRPLLLGFLAAGPVIAPAPAMAETSFVVDSSLEAGYVTNPFQSPGPSPSSAVITGSVSPELEVRDARGSYRLRGSFRHEEYLKRYRSSQDYGVNFQTERTFDARTQFSGRVGFESSIVGNNNLFLDGIPDVGADPNLPPILDDVTLNGVRQRQESLSAGLAFVHRPSERDELSLSYSGSMVRFPGVTARDEYDFISQRLGYFRRIDANLSIGGSVAVARTDYQRGTLGDGRIITPQLTARLRLGPRWTLSAGGGASITRTQTFLGRLTQTAVSASVDACYKESRSNFCLNLDRQAMPSSFDGIRTQTLVSANYNYRLSERTDVGARASYSKASQPIGNVGSSLESLSFGLNLSRTISRQLSVYANAGYGDTFEAGRGRRANAQVAAGIRFTFGDRR